MERKIVLKNKEGNKFILFMNVCFLIVSVLVYIKAGSFAWIKFNAIFILLSFFVFLKWAELSADGLNISYQFRPFKRKINIAPSTISRITVSYHESGKNYPNIGIVIKKLPFYVELRFDVNEISDRHHLFEVLEKLKESNPAIKIKFSPPKEFL